MGGTYLFLQMSVGFCDLEIPVQSLAEFYQCPYAWDVKMLLVNFLIVKTAVLLAAAGLFFCIGTAASTEVTAYGMGVILFFLSFLMQTFASPYSAGGFLREAGLTVLLDSTHYYTAVRNVNVFGYPVPAIAVGAISVLLYVGVSTAVSLRFWLHPEEIKISVQRLYRRRRTASAAMKYRSLFSFECKKLFLTERALLLSFGLILLLLFLHIPSRYVSMTEYYYGIYSENLAGDLSAEKEAYLAEEQERIETAGERIDKYYSLYEQGEIDEIELTYYLEKETIPSEQETAFRLAWNQYQKVSEVSTEEDPAVYVNESGWRRLCGAEAAKGQIRDYLIWILYLAACFNHFSCMEDTTGVRTLIRSTADGQKKVSRAKICISLLTGSISAVFLYLAQLCSVHLAWPLYEWNSVQISVQSITVLQNLGLRLPVLYYLILAGVCCAAAGAAAALVTLALSRLMGRPVKALVSAFILLGLPAVLLLI